MLNKTIPFKDIPEPKAKIGDVVIIKNKEGYVQTIVREACYRFKFENKYWAYWVDTDKYIDDNWRDGKKYITKITDFDIKDNLSAPPQGHRQNGGV